MIYKLMSKKDNYQMAAGIRILNTFLSIAKKYGWEPKVDITLSEVYSDPDEQRFDVMEEEAISIAKAIRMAISDLEKEISQFKNTKVLKMTLKVKDVEQQLINLEQFYKLAKKGEFIIMPYYC